MVQNDKYKYSDTRIYCIINCHL